MKEEDSISPSLNLSNKKLVDNEIKYLGKERKWSTSLSQLYLCTTSSYIENNNLTSTGIAFLSIQQWNHLKLLDLSKPWNNKDCNKIGDEAIHHLSSFPQLKILWLSSCGISAKGVKTLNELPFNSCLQKLALGKIFDNSEENDIQDEGVRHLNQFNCLTYLDLQKCGIGHKGV